MTTRQDGSVEIHQQILVARDTQRAIVLGKGGRGSRKSAARRAPSSPNCWASKVHLFLHVKVKENWDEDRGVYRDMGLDWVD